MNPSELSFLRDPIPECEINEWRCRLFYSIQWNDLVESFVVADALMLGVQQDTWGQADCIEDVLKAPR